MIFFFTKKVYCGIPSTHHTQYRLSQVGSAGCVVDLQTGSCSCPASSQTLSTERGCALWRFLVLLLNGFASCLRISRKNSNRAGKYVTWVVVTILDIPRSSVDRTCYSQVGDLGFESPLWVHIIFLETLQQ